MRNGYGPERKIQTGIGEVAVRAPKATDRRKKQTDKVKTPPIFLYHVKQTISVLESPERIAMVQFVPAIRAV